MYDDIPIKTYNIGHIIGYTLAFGAKSGLINCAYWIWNDDWDNKIAIILLKNPINKGIAMQIRNFFISFIDIIKYFTFLTINNYNFFYNYYV